MYEILRVEMLANKTVLMDVLAPRVAKYCYPGQFIIVRLDEFGERIPLTICDYDRDAGTVTIVFAAIGASTTKMLALGVGDGFKDFVGPLGLASEFVNEDLAALKQKKFLFVAGGVGAAPVYPQVKWLHEQGILADVIIGARSAKLVILEQEIRAVAGSLYLATDDGSVGHHGLVTDVIKKLVVEAGHQYDEVIAIGPMVMMKFVCQLTKELQIPTVVSMNSIMVDGTGMCGACRLTVGGDVKFACVDGPEFDGHLIDFDEAMKRQVMYRDEESKAMLKLSESHQAGCCSSKRAASKSDCCNTGGAE